MIRLYQSVFDNTKCTAYIPSMSDEKDLIWYMEDDLFQIMDSLCGGLNTTLFRSQI